MLDSVCGATGLQVSHAAALPFFDVFYTGTLKWTGDVQVNCGLAMQLLVMASNYYMPYVLGEVQQVLQQAIEVDNCCSLFMLATHYHADHLKAACMCFFQNARMHVVDRKDYSELDLALRMNIEGLSN